MLSGHSDLMIPTKIWTGESKANTDAKETTVLMSDLNQTRDEDGEGGNEAGTERKKEEKDTCENGVEQKEKSAKNGEVKETPAAATEDSSSPKEEGEKSQVDNSKSSATSEEKEEAKDGE
ncbi:hypothetical protein NL108_012454 [Boleophthalmus pectinirostris]|nr:hypothetical protein NL108_012454 [Boleophthalmus pectinirostris]